MLRETALPGAVLTRVAASHIRVGTFQYIAARGDVEALRELADYAIARHYPEAATAEQPYRALLDAVVARQADLVARWLLISFIHGVMNTDNTSIAGETIDYGPCASWMPTIRPRYSVPSTISAAMPMATSRTSRSRLAETLLPLLAEDGEKALAEAEQSLGSFAATFHGAYLGGLRRKLGLAAEHEGDATLAQDLLTLMAENHADFTLTFRLLCAGEEGDAAVRALFADGCAYDAWAARWRRRMTDDTVDRAASSAAMRAVNPATSRATILSRRRSTLQ